MYMYMHFVCAHIATKPSAAHPWLCTSIIALVFPHTALSGSAELQHYDGNHYGWSRFRSNPTPAPDVGECVEGAHGDVQTDGHNPRVQGGWGSTEST